MLKHLAKFFVVVLIIFSFSLEIAYAASYKSFGGEILKAENVANDGYKCDHQGKILSVKYRGVPVNFFLANTTRLWTRWDTQRGQAILGLAKLEKITIKCEKEGSDDQKQVKEISAYEIRKAGTSKQ